MKPLTLAILICVYLCGAAIAQNFDSSGNSLLHGNYFMRQVLFSGVSSQTGVIGRSRSLTGTATFDGAGHYTFSGQTFDSGDSSGQSKSFSFSGTYAVTSGGLFQMQNPLDSVVTINGGLGITALVGSSTESSDFDLLVAIPAASSASPFQGSYDVGVLDFLQGDVTQVRNATLLLTPDGQGNLSSPGITGQAANLGSGEITQTFLGGSYAFSGGSGTLSFFGTRTPQTQLVSGTKNLYVSADGSIILGGSLTGFDMLIGIQAAPGNSGNASFQGAYYTAGLEDDATTSTNFVGAFYGSVASNGAGTAIAAQRVNDSDVNAFDNTFDDEFNVGLDGSVTESFARFFIGANGKTTLLTGRSSVYSLQLGVQPLTVAQSGAVYLNPAGIVNAASYAPVTNSIAGGELINLYGTGLSPVTMTAPSVPLDTKLGGVQVSINGRPAPIYLVSNSQLSVVVPYATTEVYATIQVNNNGTLSNPVTVYTNNSAPGVFTLGASGVGPGAILHVDGNPVTAANPAHVGETVTAYATGLGLPSPPVADGAPGPSSPLSTVSGVEVFIDTQPATVTFAGLAPGFVGLYQINVQVPAAASAGAVYFDVSTPEAYHSQAIISVAK